MNSVRHSFAVVLALACCCPIASAQVYLPGHVSSSSAEAGITGAGGGRQGLSGQQSPLQGGQAHARAIPKNYASPSGFITTTTSMIEGYRIVEYKGLVEGAAVRQPTWSQDAAAGMAEVYGGDLTSYTQMCEEARREAFATLLERAKEMGANAVIGIHFDSQSFPMDKGKFSSAVVCVGTAVIARPGK